jgi:L-aspartate oxidase
VPRTARTLDLAAVEATALHTVATLLALGATARTESRGCHRRADAPESRPEWQVRLVHRADPSGRVHTRTAPVRTGSARQVVA